MLKPAGTEETILPASAHVATPYAATVIPAGGKQQNSAVAPTPAADVTV